MRFSLLILLAAAASAQEAASLLAEAARANEAGQYARAQSVLQQLLKKFPDAPEAVEARERSQPNRLLRVKPLEKNGPPQNRIDVFILGEGYPMDKQEVFDTAAKNTVKTFCLNKVFKEYRPLFNFHQMNISSREDGVDFRDRLYDTALGGKATDFAQGQVTVDHEAVASYLGFAKDAEGLAIVIVKRGSLGTGGGGIAVVGGGPSNTVIHEWGHAFGGLLDEYSADVGYEGPVRPGPNVSDTDDPTKVPWRAWIEAGIKGVGVFQGAAGRAQGAWKATAGGCTMASGSEYCMICREQIVKRMWRRVDPIDARFPEDDRVVLRPDEEKTLWVLPVRPAGHELTVEWYLRPIPAGGDVPSTTAPAPGTGTEGFSGFGGRPFQRPGGAPRRRGDRTLAPPVGEKLAGDRGLGGDKDKWMLTLNGKRLAPGAYELTARVVDPTPRDPHPWVLSDPDHLLESRVAWRIDLPDLR